MNKNNKKNIQLLWIMWKSKIKMFISLELKDKILIVKVILLTAIARFAMLKIPFKNLKKYMGQVNEESSFKIEERLKIEQSKNLKNNYNDKNSDNNYNGNHDEILYISSDEKNGKCNYDKAGSKNESDLSNIINELKRFRWAIQVVSKRTPWESKCLVQALTAQYLTNKKGITTTLYLGVKKDPDNNLIAHSWIRCGDFYITGGDGQGYAITAKFTKGRNTTVG